MDARLPRSGIPAIARLARRVALASCLLTGATQAAQLAIPGPDAGTRSFGAALTLLPNGHVVVRDPDWSAGAGLDQAGAVYLYDGNGVLLSRLTGSRAGDRVGSGGIVLLANGDFVVRSPSWRAGDAIANAGAVTFGDADIGFGAAQVVLGAGNSLVGSSADDRVGGDGVLALPNGSYVVASGDWDRSGVGADAGAATWCAADGSTVGTIDATNSLVGATALDHVAGLTVTGKPGLIALDTGHYVVATPRWDRGALVDVGAATWADGDGGTVGAVTTTNSLVGVRAGDNVAAEVQALANGHYIVQSPFWRNASVASAGAVTWAEGSAATVDEVDAGNSLVGTQAGDLVGYLAAPLTNGQYVVVSPLWDRGAIGNAGAITWRNGSSASPGVVDENNSLVGSHADDNLGFFTTIGLPPLGVVALDDGDYVVASPEWDGDAASDVGAATWGSGNGGIAGPVSAANSLIGSHADDRVGQFMLTFPSGRYVIASPYWSERRGAATLGDGDGAPVGELGAGNSLVGSQAGDFVSASGLYALPGDAYVVASERWANGETLRVGAVTRAEMDGLVGEVSTANSLVGTQANDLVGRGGVELLPDGDYVVRSELGGRGALTRVGDGQVAAVGQVTAANSMVGVPDEDYIGFPGLRAFTDGAMVQHTANGALDEAGAITLFDPAERFRGQLPEATTVRSEIALAGTGLNYVYASATGTLFVGDPGANRIVLLLQDRLYRDGFE